MSRRLISSSSPFEKTMGFSRAVVAGDWCFVAGTVGRGVDGAFPESVEEQARNALATIGRALAEGGFDFADVTRVTYYIAERSYASRIAPILGETFGRIRPAATMLVCDLIEPEMKVEIEVTAYRPG